MASHEILALDIAGMPVRWIDLETAAGYYANDKVRWELGDHRTVLLGGINRGSGQRSRLELATIVAVEGPRLRRAPLSERVPLSRSMLFMRDRHVCAYCGGAFTASLLEVEHVVPRSLGGRSIWQNLVSACRACNQRKGNRTPERARMPLLYVPYVPNQHEAFILANRRILSDQMNFLMAGVPRHSRLYVPTA